MTSGRSKPILDVLQRKPAQRVPFWLMRQAGRYLPEYRELRAKAGGFLDMVYNPAFASEVTLQPLRRYGMDAAILFSDILVVPDALGQAVRFTAGEGPRLDPIRTAEQLSTLDFSRVDRHCAPVYDTVARVRSMLIAEGFDEAALIGFCGAPWTVACYMVQGSGSKDFQAVRDFANGQPETFQRLIDLVTEASCIYLAGQIRAGAEVIQLFDSWSGLAEGDLFDRYVIAPTIRIRNYLRENFPDVPVIGFPRGANDNYMAYAIKTGVDCLGLDQSLPLGDALLLQSAVPVQGSLDPEILLAGGPALDEALYELYGALGGGPWIFNLGHGVIKETPPEHVARVSDIVKSWQVAA